ncbi:hypothetical protein JJE66_21995 [Bradyrhizobium diazoefficiens]|uniref:hypothetical protein n=1 Tax=Bradyrhizobium diazoefficiens TaxID=1355477 RepID=UPI00190DC135|nr:hypothetical protein [Bradyrhizobium diazoefficiens]MBK3663883.1 hypothetical protein [Bradyrhizobium diazoefficiens]
MLEISVFCVIVLAAGYWATMFVMGRRDDVIHGKFVYAEDESSFTQASMPTPPPPFPKRPVIAARSASVQPASVQPHKAETVTSEALQSLLAAIQQDLKSVA